MRSVPTEKGSVMRYAATGSVFASVVLVVMVIAALAIAATLGSFGGVAHAGDLPAAAKQMHAFKGKPIRDSFVPVSVRAAEQRLASKGGLGAVMANQTRLLATSLGRNDISAYAVPTTGGAVCLVLAEKTTVSMCVPGGAEGFDSVVGDVAWGIYSGTEVPVTVYGLVSDSVASVRVNVDGTLYDAAIEDNSIYWQAGDGVGRANIKGLVVRQNDGSEDFIDLHSDE